SALGGDGELEETLFEYLNDYYNNDEVLGVLDNIRLLAKYALQKDEYRQVVRACLNRIQSEVSRNFITRLLAIAEIPPFPSNNGWAQMFNGNGRGKGFGFKELLDPDIMLKELPSGMLSRQTIRNQTREERLPWLYPLTLFLKPSVVSDKIITPQIKDCTLNWEEKERFIREELGYKTERVDREGFVMLENNQGKPISQDGLPYRPRSPPKTVKIVLISQDGRLSSACEEIIPRLEKILPVKVNSTIALSLEQFNLQKDANGQYLVDDFYSIAGNIKRYSSQDAILLLTDVDVTGFRNGKHLDYLFGRASPEKNVTVMSTHRFYSPDRDLYQRRVLKNAIHELGHIFGLGHCDDSACVMRFSKNVEELDKTGLEFCPSCKKILPSNSRADFLDNGGSTDDKLSRDVVQQRQIVEYVLKILRSRSESNQLTEEEQEIYERLLKRYRSYEQMLKENQPVSLPKYYYSSDIWNISSILSSKAMQASLQHHLYMYDVPLGRLNEPFQLAFPAPEIEKYNMDETAWYAGKKAPEIVLSGNLASLAVFNTQRDLSFRMLTEEIKVDPQKVVLIYNPGQFDQQQNDVLNQAEDIGMLVIEQAEAIEENKLLFEARARFDAISLLNEGRLSINLKVLKAEGFLGPESAKEFLESLKEGDIVAISNQWRNFITGRYGYIIQKGLSKFVSYPVGLKGEMELRRLKVLSDRSPRALMDSLLDIDKPLDIQLIRQTPAHIAPEALRIKSFQQALLEEDINLEKFLSPRAVMIEPSLLEVKDEEFEKKALEVIAARVDQLHIDVADGRFTDRLTDIKTVAYRIGFLKQNSDLPVDVHLMVVVDKPGENVYINECINAGADIIIVHFREAHRGLEHLNQTINYIKSKGRKVGIALKINDTVEDIEDVLTRIDAVLFLAVDPGYGGSPFSIDVLGKVKALRKTIDAKQISLAIQVDGGVKPENAKIIIGAGADILISGSAIFDRGDISIAVAHLRELAFQPSYFIRIFENKFNNAQPNWILRILASPFVLPHELGNLIQAVITGRLSDLEFSWKDLFSGLRYSGRAPPCLGGTSTNLALFVISALILPQIIPVLAIPLILYGILNLIHALIEIYFNIKGPSLDLPLISKPLSTRTSSYRGRMVAGLSVVAALIFGFGFWKPNHCLVAYGLGLALVCSTFRGWWGADVFGAAGAGLSTMPVFFTLGLILSGQPLKLLSPGDPAALNKKIRVQDREDDVGGSSVDKRWAEEFKKETLRTAIQNIRGRDIFIFQMEYELSMRFLRGFSEYLIKTKGCSSEEAVYNTGELAKILMTGGLGSFKPDLVKGFYEVLEEYWGSIEARKRLTAIGILYSQAIKGQGPITCCGPIANDNIIDMVRQAMVKIKIYRDIELNMNGIGKVDVEIYMNPYSELNEYWLYCPQVFHEAYCGESDDDFRAVQTLLYRKVAL
ncbi:MAG: hypothetical protein ABIH27_02215, partial [Candidatus Omnitrophota bacterium]